MTDRFQAVAARPDLSVTVVPPTADARDKAPLGPDRILGGHPARVDGSDVYLFHADGHEVHLSLRPGVVTPDTAIELALSVRPGGTPAG